MHFNPSFLLFPQIIFGISMIIISTINISYIIIIIIVSSARWCCYIICIAQFSLYLTVYKCCSASFPVKLHFFIFKWRVKVLSLLGKSCPRWGGVHASIVPEEGSGKATSCLCCSGHHGRERSCPHTKEKSWEGDEVSDGEGGGKNELMSCIYCPSSFPLSWMI